MYVAIRLYAVLLRLHNLRYVFFNIRKPCMRIGQKCAAPALSERLNAATCRKMLSEVGRCLAAVRRFFGC